MATSEILRFEHDVVVIGAGGAGLRAAIECSAQGCKTALVCKSLLGKAHTVMAEGGVAAALANVDGRDTWQEHFRDTMRGGKEVNNYRMAELHAKESPDRVNELEAWGAVFDRTGDGRILQRNFGGHRYPRLAHVGDRTGLEIIRTLQDKGVHSGIEVFMEHTVVDFLKDGDRVSACLSYDRERGRFKVFRAKAFVLATGGVGRCYRITSNSWEYTGDGHAMALRAGAELIDMEFLQFHPTGMIWPPSVKGILVTEGVRGEGGILKNSLGKRFMFDYIPPYFAKDFADTQVEAENWVASNGREGRRPPELLTRDVVARAIRTEVRGGRGSPHGGAFLDIASRRSAEDIRRKLPSMYHQFKELAGVDITREPMEVGPTCHYMMGGILVDADSGMSTVPGLFAAGECAGGLHGANRLGGNSLSDLLVFGRRAGLGAANFAKANELPTFDEARAEALKRSVLVGFDSPTGPSSYDVVARLQEVMEEGAGIVRSAEDLAKCLEALEALKGEAKRLRVTGSQEFNPGWHLAIDLRNLLVVSEAIARAAQMRLESRGGHSRLDFPETSGEWGKCNLVCHLQADQAMSVARKDLPDLPPELTALLA